MLKIPSTWTKETYKSYIEYLISIKEDEYKEFHSKLCFTKYEILGIRLPIIREIVKQISKTNYIDFLNLTKSNYYEEVMIEGLIISHIKDELIFDKYFNNFINKIDNWGICDSFCNSLNIEHKLIRPRTPRHNGKVERSHRNDSERFYKFLSFYSYDDLKYQMKNYLKRSNNTPMQTLEWLTLIEMR